MPLCIKDVPEEVGKYVKSHFRYEPETGLLYRLKTYSNSVDITKPVGSINSQGYLDVDLSRGYGTKGARNTRVHRVAWFLHYGDWPDFQLDHINGDMKDNRISNLRATTQRLNQGNRSARQNVSSRFKGVGLSRGKWRAYIVTPETRYKHLGYFQCEEGAAKAYDAAAKEVFGDYARLNFPAGGSKSAVCRG